MANPLPPEIMQRLQEEYAASIPDKIRELRSLIDHLHQDINEKNLADLRLFIHKLAGNSGTYGFLEVSNLCKSCEQDVLQKIDLIKKSKSDPAWMNIFETYFLQIKEGFSRGTGNKT